MQEYFLLQLFSGLASGANYALLALALVIVYRATHYINLAQGEIATFCVFVAWYALQAGMPYWAAFATSLAAAFVMGCLLELVIMRRFGKSEHLTLISVLVGLLMIQHALTGAVFGYTIQTMPSPFSSIEALYFPLISAHEFGSILLCLAVIAIVFFVLRYTKIGLAMRAVADNPTSASLVGISNGVIIAFSWGLASVVGTVAGLMAAPALFLEPNIMTNILVYAFAGALLGGIDNPWGAAAGGFLIGVGENLVGGFLIGEDLKLAFALSVIILVLLFRPNGLFGRTIHTRV